MIQSKTYFAYDLSVHTKELFLDKHSLQINPFPHSIKRELEQHPACPWRQGELPPRFYQQRIRAGQNMPLHFFYATLGTPPALPISPGHRGFIWRNVPPFLRRVRGDPDQRGAKSIATLSERDIQFTVWLYSAVFLWCRGSDRWLSRRWGVIVLAVILWRRDEKGRRHDVT